MTRLTKAEKTEMQKAGQRALRATYPPVAIQNLDLPRESTPESPSLTASQTHLSEMDGVESYTTGTTADPPALNITSNQ